MASSSVTTERAATGQPPCHLSCSPDEVAFLLVLRQLSPRDMERLARLMRADVAGRLPYSQEQMQAWSVADFRAAADSVALVDCEGGRAHG